MAKVVKFCAVCEEGFAEKFGFCPNCGGALAAYEMNPVAEKTNVGAVGNVEAMASAPVFNESPVVPMKPTPEPVIETFSSNGDDAGFSENESFREAEAVTVSPAAVGSGFSQDFSQSGYGQNGNGSSNGYTKTVATNQTKYGDGAYRITIVEEKNASGRNLLLLGAFLLVTTVALGGIIYSLFNSNAFIGSLGDEAGLTAYIGEDVPAVIEPDPPPKKNPDKGGGGGGGGREEETETSKGRLAPQMRATPQLAPTKTIEQKDFDLKYQATTVGDPKPVKKTDEKYGNPNAAFGLKESDGTGKGGGQGSGRGNGQGSGRGNGQGSGIGDGSGNGNGNGNGDGKGDGDSADRPPAPKKPVVAVVSEPFKIISRPRPPYTDAARQNQVTGVVRVRVTFLASGQIGSVSTVNGLPYGLTEQAIAAAKGIKFEPAKRNGVAVPTTKVIEYNFSIY